MSGVIIMKMIIRIVLKAEVNKRIVIVLVQRLRLLQFHCLVENLMCHEGLALEGVLYGQ